MTKTLSIIIPSYNMEDYLTRCLDSLIIKNMNYLEIIVVNDGSKDRTLKIAQSYARQFPKTVTVIDKCNGNYGSCINAALKIATGKYIRILDADDYYDSSSLQQFMEFLNAQDCDMILSDYVTVNSTGQMTSAPITLPLQDLAYKQFTIEELLQRYTGIISQHFITYRKNILEQIQYHQTEGISYTDMQWIFEPMTQVQSVTYFPHVIYMYFVGRDGQTVSVPISKRANSIIPILKWEIDTIEKYQESLPDYIKTYLHNCFLFMASRFYIDSIYNGTTEETNSHLSNIDILLEQKLPDLFELTKDFDNQSNFPFSFINYWRRHGRKNKLLTIIFMRKTHRVASRIKSLIK